ncbi:glycoside hydrolase family 28 protein [Psychrosphaera aquimarina]|uniref:Glycoside hydrolase family 28 protein n=1 Tax=Psychrosphaera aquimarina TaxID=2044854 RepID=A0ABU3R3X8_9GAMM|nr:glycoside hydrolase family 28 protein [Psychrosphaera aquimarina]MDU0114388.1 glycoside hydrolase family 28 protein [Psychrosphaera aquimarina]
MTDISSTGLKRRNLIKALGAASVYSAFAPNTSFAGWLFNNEQKQDDWIKAATIRANVIRPTFQDKVFNLVDYFEISDVDYEQAFQRSIQACHAAGGGQVVVPKGEYLTGPIHLLSNVNLHLNEGAVVRFVTDPKRYLPAVITRWEGMELMGYSPLIYAYKQTNIAITGKGILDGSGDNNTWWPWKGPHKEGHWALIEGEDQKPARMKLMADVENNVPVNQRHYAEGAYLRPPFIQPYLCQNILIEGVTITNSPFWLVNPVLSQHVTVKGVKFISHGPNSDGCDPESCDHVLIEDCMFDTGDDCIAIKSGRNADGRRINIPSQNIVIRNCLMKEGHGGVVIGSEISGGVNNVFVEDCQMDSPHLERAIRIKTNSIRGGVIEHLRYRNINVGKVKNAIVVNFYYEEGDAGKFDPTVRDVVIENLRCTEVLNQPLNLQGFERKPISDFHLINCEFIQASKASTVKNITNFTLENVTINGQVVSPEALINAS